MLVGTILAQYWTMSRSSVGVKTPMDNLVLAPLAIPIHQLRSTLSALEEKQSRLEASELVISLLAGQKEQQKILDSLQKQLTDAQQAAVEQKDELSEDEPHHRQIKVAVINEVEAGNGKTVVKEESAQVFDPSDQVKPVEESTPRDDVKVNQDELPLDS